MNTVPAPIDLDLAKKASDQLLQDWVLLADIVPALKQDLVNPLARKTDELPQLREG